MPAGNEIRCGGGGGRPPREVGTKSNGCGGVALRSSASCAAFRKSPHRNAHLASFVGEVLDDPGTREDDDADRKCFEHRVVALERRRVLVPGPIRFERDLRDFAVVRPAGGDAFRALRSGSMEKDHVRVLRANLVESCPDALMIVAVGTARESYSGTGGEEHLCLGQLLGVEKIPAVDHCGGQSAVIDLRSRTRTPGRTCFGRIKIREMVAEEFEGVAALRQRQPLGDQSLQLDRTNFRAILLGMGTTLRGFIVVEIAADSIRFAVEEIHEGPEKVGKIGLEPRVDEKPRQGFDDKFERQSRGVGGG